MTFIQLVDKFNLAVTNSDTASFYETGNKIANIYALKYKTSKCYVDYEYIKTEAVIKSLEVAKSTLWKKQAQYYFAIIKKQIYWQICEAIKKDGNIIKLESIQDDDGNSCYENISLKPIVYERSKKEELELKIAELARIEADKFTPKEQVVQFLEETYNLSRRTIYQIIKKFHIQFTIKDRLSNLIHDMAFYSEYYHSGLSIREFSHLKKIQMRTISNRLYSGANGFYSWKDEKQAFIACYILEPNKTTAQQKHLATTLWPKDIMENKKLDI